MGKTVLVCTNVDCADRGSEQVLDRLHDAVERNDLEVEVRDYLCFSACEKGPNVVVVEDRVWYAGVQPEDVDTIAVEHLMGGEIVEALTRDTDTITKNLIFIVLDAGIMPGTV
ncbi:(2Fe-2S) ferredoxin domain-containing protein [Sporichthya sp.]|uniref:(2Fe-2S) ferredoxin domain-containing protein n=1 Tax=Sporichthya sp. TaxID=65475 RepID=UPI001802014B|nr:(2Fe-2S) ferredoxin domain-containing protein [Sporichthya sp.]MBA3742190.1 (2Fe-2S) ferredoxin domain-containing protein [Sporichthya sp.]